MTTEVEAKAQRLSDALSAMSTARQERDAHLGLLATGQERLREAEAEVARVEAEFKAALADLLAPAEAAQADVVPVAVPVDPPAVGLNELTAVAP